MKVLLKYLKPYIARMSLGVTIKFIATIMDLFLPWILAYMIDTVVPREDLGAIAFWGIMMLVCSVIAVISNITANRMAARVAGNVTRTFRHDLYAKSLELSCAQVDETSIPKLITCLSSDTYNVHRMIGDMQRLGIRAPILLLGGIFVTLSLEPVLALTLISVLPFIAIVVYLVSRKGIPLYDLLQQAVDGMVRVIRENATGIRVIKALSREGDEKVRFAEVNGTVKKRERSAATTMAVSSPIMNLLLNLGLVLVVLVGAMRVDSGFTQPGKVLAFLSYFALILNAMMMVTRMFVMLSRGTASAGRIAEILNMPKDLAQISFDKINTDAHIIFNQVGFAYAKQSEGKALFDISFELKKGQTLGIIGGTGSGKSTLIKLLMRLYDPDSGEIRISGENIKSISPDKFYNKFGVVLQDDVLFADSLKENVDFGRDLNEEDLRRAIVMAQADEFAGDDDKRLAQRGANLSGGQKQRLMIARALAAQPEIIILDDSSSALDYKTDSNLRASIRREFKNTTAIIVAQRVSSVMHSDLILLLDEGRIAGRGTHEELLAQSEIYREIAQSQMGDI